MPIFKHFGKDVEDPKTTTCLMVTSNTRTIQRYHKSLIQKMKKKDVQFAMSFPEQPIIKTVIWRNVPFVV